MLKGNQEQMNKHWEYKNKEKQNKIMMGIGSMQQVINIYLILLFFQLE